MTRKRKAASISAVRRASAFNTALRLMIESSSALVNGESIGPPGPLADQAAVGDLLLPQRGLFVVARTRFEQPVNRNDRVSFHNRPLAKGV